MAALTNETLLQTHARSLTGARTDYDPLLDLIV